MKRAMKENIPVVILCGGEGTRFGKITQNMPKPMIEIGGQPILLHLMRIYAEQGFRRFVLCLGYRSDIIKDFFLRKDIRQRDIRLNFSTGDQEFLGTSEELDWEIILAETGPKTQTGGRLKRVSQYLDQDRFFLTYGDGLADIDLEALLEFHLAHGCIGTLSGVRASSQFGELDVDENATVRAFVEKPQVQSVINGGFFVFEKAFLDYVSDDPGCILERGPLEGLTRNNQLKMRLHGGFWQCMDTFKDYQLLNEIWDQGNAPWRVSAE